MRAAILTYHSLDHSGSVISLAPSVFENHMEILAQSGVPVLPLTQIQGAASGVALTFDDGFANFAEWAAPVLDRFGFPATVFLVSGHCGGFNDWASAGAPVPRLPLMPWSEIARLSAGSRVEWGAHTRSHPDLTRIPRHAVVEEMRSCREEIEQRTGQRVKSFAYPYGAVNAEARAVAEAEFETACGTRLTFLSAGEMRSELPRLDAYYLRDSARLKRLWSPSGRAYIGLRRGMREARSWFSR